MAADLSETNRRKTEFLATLAHELRNPLAPMRTGLDLLRLNAGDGQGGARVLAMMDRQLRQMVHLIDDLMDVSRINSGKIVLKTECIDIAVAVHNALEAARPALAAGRHAFHLASLEQPAMVQADPTRLTQVLVNLLTNAAKYTPHGGQISLTLRILDGEVEVAVADNGVGIPPEEQAAVFEMFSQVSKNMGRAQGGLGIGLSLVRSLVEMHGGTITLSSPGAGQGSTFTVTLPLAPECGPDASGAQAALEERGAGRAPGQPGLRVLVADDNVDAAGMLVSLLRAAGHLPEAVHDGRAALARIVAERPDLAILDIGMPGLNGYEVAQQVRRTPSLAQTVLVALTGWGGVQDREQARRAGFDAHLTKPAGFAELKRLIADIAARR
jgi:CheY-like chemotaxis protein/two-component sensor histidine kinase